MKSACLLFVSFLLPVALLAADDTAETVLVDARRIWNGAPRNAFADLVRFKDGFGYGCGAGDRGLRLFKSSDGNNFETLIDQVNVEGTYPNETSIVFLPDDTALLPRDSYS